jgi:putative Mg2+ transporter-C (MgtC) family protein
MHLTDLPTLQHCTGLLLLAVLLGGVIGIDRERTEHPAGLRTHILVCVGAALITLIDLSVAKVGGHIMGQIITGIGFLGAGTILRDTSGTMVRGLTTAASIWTVAAIGMAVGTGGAFAELAAVTTMIVFVTLSLLDNLEPFINRNRRFQDLTFVIATDKDPLERMADALNSLHNLGVRTGKFRIDQVQGGQIVHLTLRMPNSTVRDRVKPTLEANPNIIHVEWGIPS